MRADLYLGEAAQYIPDANNWITGDNQYGRDQNQGKFTADSNTWLAYEDVVPKNETAGSPRATSGSKTH